METHQADVFRLAYLILRDADEAEDVAQAVFIRAYKQWDRFDASRPVRPWLLTITKNMAYNHQRSAKRYLAMVQRFFQNQPPSSFSHTRHLGTQLDRADEAQALHQAVADLSKKHQEVIFLRYFMELSESETAETLNISPGTVKSRTHRALAKLRERITPTNGES